MPPRGANGSHRTVAGASAKPCPLVQESGSSCCAGGTDEGRELGPFSILRAPVPAFPKDRLDSPPGLLLSNKAFIVSFFFFFLLVWNGFLDTCNQNIGLPNI